MPFLVRDVLLALSKLRESAFNTQFSAATDYLALDVDPIVSAPEMEKTDNVGKAGIEFATYICNRYWQPPQLALAGDVEFDVLGRLALRAFGGTVTETTPVAGSKKYALPMMAVAAGLQLPSSDITVLLDDISFIYAGLVINSLEISQQGNNIPRYSANLLGSGKFVNPIGFTPPSLASVTACPSDIDVAIFWTDSGGTRDLAATSCQVRSWRAFLNNNIETDPNEIRCAGDPLVGPSGGQARYVRGLPRSAQGRQAGVELSLLVDDLSYWTQMAKNDDITNLTIRLRGPLISGTTYNEHNYKLPVCTVRGAQAGDSNGKAVWNLQMVPKKDPVSGLGATWDTTNTTAGGGTYS